jgi:hypothetical protein
MLKNAHISNKILFKKWQEYENVIHKKKLLEMRSRVDSTSPAAYRHLKDKRKKEQNLEGFVFLVLKFKFVNFR